ncbi:hypothetical protein [Caballeronia sp. TF1N1]|uniref:hypothetical protein n=1 Tax=Caballeronia sp. TF1N1 TaxID=2878153 RepID=UPI001FD20996|nr:hypothetical protein [Caballeronia sp. TF1N1]
MNRVKNSCTNGIDEVQQWYGYEREEQAKLGVLTRSPRDKAEREMSERASQVGSEEPRSEREAIVLPMCRERRRVRVTCTAAIVDAWLALPRLNRHFDQRVADRYAQTMVEGYWRECNGDCLRFTSNGKLGDGQHRLDAARQALQYGVAITFDVEVAIDPDVVLSFDSGRRRLPRDVATMQGLAPWEAQKAAQAASLLFNYECRQAMWMTQAPGLFEIDAYLRTHPEISRSASFMKALNLRGVPYPYGLAVAMHTLFSPLFDPSLQQFDVLAPLVHALARVEQHRQQRAVPHTVQ